jgi:Chorismate mutase
MDLEELRAEIVKTDRMIMELLKRRLDLARQVGEYKLANNKEIVNTSVEDAVVKRYVNFAIENDMDPENIEEVCRLLIKESVELQKRLISHSK